MELALETGQKRMKGEPAESLLKKVCQNLGGQSTAAYRQFLSDFIESMIALEKKPDMIASKWTKPIETPKQSIAGKEPRKQKKQTKSALNEESF